jgi:hypothetical protein
VIKIVSCSEDLKKEIRDNLKFDMNIEHELFIMDSNRELGSLIILNNNTVAKLSFKSDDNHHFWDIIDDVDPYYLFEYPVRCSTSLDELRDFYSRKQS